MVLLAILLTFSPPLWAQSEVLGHEAEFRARISEREVAERNLEQKVTARLVGVTSFTTLASALSTYYDGVKLLHLDPDPARVVKMIVAANPGARLWMIPKSRSGQPGDRLVIGINGNRLLLGISLKPADGSKPGNQIEVFRVLSGIKSEDIGRPGKVGVPGVINLSVDAKSETPVSAHDLMRRGKNCVDCHDDGTPPQKMKFGGELVDQLPLMPFGSKFFTNELGATNFRRQLPTLSIEAQRVVEAALGSD